MDLKPSSIAKVRKKIAINFESILGAWHESSHAIFALLHYMRVDSVCIYEHKEAGRIYGYTNCNTLDELENITDPELLNVMLKAEIGLYYSGFIAEQHFFKSISGSSQTPMFIKDGSSYDTKCAADLIKKYQLAPPGTKRYAYKKKLIREIQEELFEHWDAIQVIAFALIKKHKLSYADLKSLLTKKTLDKYFWKEQFRNLDHFYLDKEDLEEKDLRQMLLP